MNRRSFFKKAALGAAVIAIAPAVLSEPFIPQQPIVATIGEYADYVNFSSLAITQSIDEAVSNAATELGHQAGLELERLISDGVQA